MVQLKAVRGTQDVLPAENRLFRHVEATAHRIAEQYGYGEISTPIFEFSEVFKRTLGRPIRSATAGSPERSTTDEPLRMGAREALDAPS